MEQYQASIEADMIAAKLQVRLPKEVWEAIEAEWQAKPDTQAYLPTQRLDYLIAKASMHDALDIVPLSAFGG